MSRTKVAPGPDQEALFAAEDVMAAQQTAAPVPLRDPELPGPTVKIDERAYELSETLRLLNAANSRAGLQAAMHTSSAENLEARYGDQLGSVLDNAELNESANLRSAKRHFAQAAGKTALIRAGFPKDEVEKLTDQMYRSFTAKYGVGVTTGKVRNKKAKEIQKSAKIINTRPSKSV